MVGHHNKRRDPIGLRDKSVYIVSDALRKIAPYNNHRDFGVLWI